MLDVLVGRSRRPSFVGASGYPPSVTTVEIACRRLASQHLADPGLGSAAEVVSWLGAVQAQDYPMAGWSVGQRTPSLTQADLDRAYRDGHVLRTHVMRPTWHFVHPADLRWLLELTAPRVHLANAHHYRTLGLDDELAVVATKVITGALTGGNRLTRKELAGVLEQAGIEVGGLRMAYLMMRAELDGLVCSGGLAGRQHTYALLEERVPAAAPRGREESLVELVVRYFTSHGPATVKDFVWWSGLTAADTRRGLDAAGDRLDRQEVDGRVYWLGSVPRPYRDPPTTVRLVQCFDECVVGYGDSRGALDVFGAVDEPRESRTFVHPILLDTQVVGFWRRVLAAATVVVQTDLLMPLDSGQRAALDQEVHRYAQFLGRQASWV